MGSSANSTSRMIPSGGEALKNGTPTPPRVTSRLTRSGFVAADAGRDAAAEGVAHHGEAVDAEPVQERQHRPGGVDDRGPVDGWLLPKPGRSSTRVRKCSAKSGRLPLKFAQPLTPGPDPCRSRSGGPSPASW